MKPGTRLKLRCVALLLLIFGSCVNSGLLSPALAYHGEDGKPAGGFSDSLQNAGAKVGEIVRDDGNYFFRSIGEDVVDLFKLPAEDDVWTAKNLFAGALLVGAIPATVYGLDKPIRRGVRDMNDGTADILRNVGLGVTVGGVGAVYGWGVLAGNEEARHVALTGVEGIGVASLLGLATKAAFGRSRPRQGDGPRAFFEGGKSFPSGQAVVAFAAATTLSEGFDNRWWVAAPAYGLALMTGIGRMGKDAHWASDVLASSLIGVGTTKLLFYLHRRREWSSSSLVITPMVGERGVSGAALSFAW